MTDKKVINVLDRMMTAIVEDGKSLINEDITVQYEAIKRGMEALKAASSYKTKIDELKTQNKELVLENNRLELEAMGLKKCTECKNKYKCYNDEEDMDRVVECDDFIVE